MMRCLRPWILVAFALGLAACGGGGASSPSSSSSNNAIPATYTVSGTLNGTSSESSSSSNNAIPATYTVSGTLIGLPAGDFVTLQNNNTDSLTLTANGAFTFPTQLDSGAAYSVTVATQTLGITCTVYGAGSVTLSSIGVITPLGVNSVVCDSTPAPNVTVAPATYSASTVKSAFFADINTMRGAAGLSLLAQNPSLDTSAQDHANYLGVNYTSSMEGVIDPTTGMLYAHSEDVGMPDFFAATPQARATKAGYTGFATEVAVNVPASQVGVAGTADTGDQMFNDLMNTVYHRGAMMQDSLRDIGIGYASPEEFVADMGYTGTPQSPAPGTLVAFPSDNTIDPYPYWMAGFESPNPTPTVPSGTGMGGAVSIESPSGSSLAVETFQLLDTTGAVVPCFEMDSSNDPNKDYINNNQAFLVPKSALSLASNYKAMFSGTVNGVSVQKSWTFSTPAETLQPITQGPYVLHNGSSVNIRISAPSMMTGFIYTSPSTVPTASLHVNVSDDMITLSLDPNAMSATANITVTATDTVYSSVPGQNFSITVEP